MQLRQSKVAGEALARINAVAKSADIVHEYKSRASNFPAMVLQSGLAQAVGFLQAKSGGAGLLGQAYRRYLEDLAGVMHAGDGALPDRAQALCDQIMGAGLADYRRMSYLAIDAASWLKRMAQAHLRNGDRP